MQKKKFVIQIHASREKVWSTLWDDETFRDWGGIIDEGQYMVGEIQEGNVLQFIGGSGYGVTTRIEKCTPNELIILRHQADTRNSGKQKREKEWTGGEESYALTETDGVTNLIVEMDTPDELAELFDETFPKALERVKFLSE